MPMIINDHLYKYYPIVNLDVPAHTLDSMFVDSFKLCPIYLSTLGGDHDGDQVTGKIIYSAEANEDAERIMNAKTNLISINGEGIRHIGNEGTQTMFTITRFVA